MFEILFVNFFTNWAMREAQMVKCLPPVQETWGQSLCQKISWRRKWQPIPVFLPGESFGWATVHGVAKSRTQLSDFIFVCV